MTTLFVSDLHLPETASPLRSAFLAFLAGPARAAQAVYLLGDLFEYWIGDDVGIQRYGAETDALRQLVDSGVRVWFQGGNRDFILGDAFFARTGVQPLPDPYVSEIEGVRTLLSHGDVFCTDDRNYQRWRRFSRIPVAQRIFHALPLRLRRAFGDNLRSHSEQARSYKPASILDVNAHAIERAFATSGAQCMIHGHTHRPAEHHLEVGGQPRERIVLADWHDDRHEYLEIGKGKITRRCVKPA
jgi:UDP-2,3-diacylglucosamine hydrolase